MSQIHKGIFGALAVALSLGVAQLASGHDLIGSKPTDTGATLRSDVNRAAKADRTTVPSSPPKSRTIALRFDSLAATSVLVRVPVAKETGKEARNDTRTSPAPAAGKRKAAVACEPVVSVLTEVAKLLEPGRCVT